MKKFIVIAAILVCFFAVNAYAAGWTVVKAGYVSGAGVQLVLNDGAQTITAYASTDAAFENKALATALTAKSGTLNVEIGGWSGGRFGTIKLVDP